MVSWVVEIEEAKIFDLRMNTQFSISCNYFLLFRYKPIFCQCKGVYFLLLFPPQWLEFGVRSEIITPFSLFNKLDAVVSENPVIQNLLMKGI